MDKNDKRYIQLGLKIAYYRKLAGFTQEEMAEEIDMSLGFISQVEAPGIVQPVSLKTLFAIADLCGIEPYKLLMFD